MSVVAGLGLLIAPGSTPTAGREPARAVPFPLPPPSSADAADWTRPVPPGAGPVDEPGESGANALTSEQRELVDWVRTQFGRVGLVLPDVEIAFHAGTEACRGGHGRFRGPLRRVDICTPATGPSSKESFRRRTIVHEMAHAWDHDKLVDSERASLLDVLGADVWHDDDIPWGDRGAERFAEAVVWATYEQLRRPTLVRMPCARLHAAFVAATERAPLEPWEVVCDLGRADPATPTTGGDR